MKRDFSSQETSTKEQLEKQAAKEWREIMNNIKTYQDLVDAKPKIKAYQDKWAKILPFETPWGGFKG